MVNKKRMKKRNSREEFAYANSTYADRILISTTIVRRRSARTRRRILHFRRLLLITRKFAADADWQDNVLVSR